MDEERRYGDREVESIIARAVELSREAEAPARPRGGMTLGEVERIAIEAGLSVESVRRAAGDLEAAARARASGLRRFFGAEKIKTDLCLPCQPGEAVIRDLLVVLPDLADVSGSGVAVPGGFVWRSDGGYEAHTGSRLRIELRREGSASRLKVERSFDGAAGGIFGGIMGGFGLGGGLGIGLGVGLGELHSGFFALVFSLGSLAISWALSRGLMGLYGADARRRNARLVTDLEARLAGSPEDPGKGA